MTPVLLTQRLLLRPFEHDDAGALADLLNDPAVAVGVCSAPLPFTQLHASARILMTRARELAGKDFAWAVEDEQGDLIGMVSLNDIGPNTYRLGYAYARAVWGQGYATETLQSVLTWAGRSLGGAYLQADVFLDNPASAAVLKKLGFTETGQSARFSLARDASEPTRTFALSEAA